MALLSLKPIRASKRLSNTRRVLNGTKLLCYDTLIPRAEWNSDSKSIAVVTCMKFTAAHHEALDGDKPQTMKIGSVDSATDEEVGHCGV